MKLWNDENEKFALMREKLYTPVVGDILDELGYYVFLVSVESVPSRRNTGSEYLGPAHGSASGRCSPAGSGFVGNLDDYGPVFQPGSPVSELPH